MRSLNEVLYTYTMRDLIDDLAGEHMHLHRTQIYGSRFDSVVVLTHARGEVAIVYGEYLDLVAKRRIEKS